LWEAYDSLGEDLKDDHMKATLEEYEEMPVDTAIERVRFVQRWQKWCIDKSIGWRQPLIPHVNLFLRERSKGGPTAAHGAYTQFRWLERHMGFVAHTEHPIIVARSKVDGAHEPVPTKPTSPKAWLWLRQLLRKCSGPAQYAYYVTLFWVFLILTGLRFTHGQRASVEKIGSYYMCGRVARGKAKKRGKRVPMAWSAPRFDVGVDLAGELEALKNHYQDETGDMDSWFILPDFYPDRCKLSEVRGFVARPMLAGRALGYLKELLMNPGAGITNAELSELGAHGPRHWLPTAAHLSNFTVAERVEMGGWAGRGSAGEKDADAFKAVLLPLRYVGQEPRLRKAAMLKSELFIAMDLALQKYKEAMGYPADKDLNDKKIDASWEALAPFWPARDVSALLARGRIEEIESADRVRAVGHDPLPIENAQGDSDTSSGDEVSDSDSGGESANGMYPSDEQAQLSWAKARKGMLHICCANDCGLVTYASTVCGRNLTMPVLGVGLDSAIAEGGRWSPRCFKALSQSTQDAWSNADNVT